MTWALVGFLLAIRGVIANDSISFFGTFIAANEKVHWGWLWATMSTVMLGVLWYGWGAYSGDISYGRLESIPYREVRWWHATAPLVLLLLTQWKIPASTSFLVLSAFASGQVLQEMFTKSFLGYVVAATVGYFLWRVLAQWLNEDASTGGRHGLSWKIGLWISTAFLWSTWLMHDLANIAVFLPRQVPLGWMFAISIVFVLGLAWTFRERGGKIQEIVINKHSVRYVRSATIINIIYATTLIGFKELSSIPMSTTFVFIGLLCGRELAIARTRSDHTLKLAFPIVATDFGRLMMGAFVSALVFLAISWLVGE